MVKLFTKFYLKPGRLAIKSLLVMVTLLAMRTSAIQAQTTAIKITGTVVDAKGEALIGVSIKLKGTSNGTVTDVNGKYSITVPNEKTTLVFTYIGYVNAEEAVGTRKTLNVTLAEQASSLDEVVITGYGETVKKRDLTGSIATVSAKQIQERQPVTLEDALEGQAAGVLVASDGGDPNGTGTITIRGLGTLNSGSSPLYVIDGVINSDANFLNPADIASIEILKDAASAAIYGSRAANGVIIITTKHGQDGKPAVTSIYTHLWGKIAHALPTLTAQQAREYRYYDKGQNAASFGANPDSLNRYLNNDNNYFDLLTRIANKDTYNLSVSGGQKGLTYYTGLNYLDDRSIIINSYKKTVASTINVDYIASDKFKITNNLNFAYSNGNNVPLGTTIQQIYERNPWISIYTPSGQLAPYVEAKKNLVAYALQQTNFANQYLGQYNTALNYNILKDLRLTTSFNIKFTNNNTQTFTPNSVLITALGSTATDIGGQVADILVNWQLQSFLNYTHVFGKFHSLKLTGGFTREHTSDNNYSVGASNYLNETVFTSNVGTLNPSTGNNPTITNGFAYGTESLLARFDYNYKSKYILTGTYRRDGSSRFGPKNKWGNFFGTGFAWRFSDEPFMQWAKKYLDDGKLRLSTGTLGNDQLGNYSFINQISFGAANAISSYAGNGTAQLSTTLGNPSIKWESTTTRNVALDLIFLKGRLTFTPEYYIKNTNDLLYAKNVAEETGSVKTAVNVGSISNKGLELTITGTPVANKNINWNISANVTFQQPGVVTKLADGAPFYTNGGATNSPFYITQGGRVGDFYVLQNLGVYQYDVSNNYAANGDRLTPVGVSADGKTATSFLDNGQPYTGTMHQLTRNGHVLTGGEVIWKDNDNNGVIDANDKAIIGNATPKTFWGLTNFFTYKQFSLSFTFNASFGNKIYNEFANQQQQNLTGSYSLPPVDFFLNVWHKQGDIAKYPAIYNFATKVVNGDTYGDISNGINGLYVEDGAFVRLESLKLTYNLDTKLAKKIFARSLSVYAYGNNLLTWTNYSGIDPEFSTNAVGSSLAPGWDTGIYPRRREGGIGINIGF